MPASRPRPTPTHNCDEYPFASTDEGTAHNPAPNSGSVWTPKAEQDSQRGYISSFYAAWRILPGDGPMLLVAGQDAAEGERWVDAGLAWIEAAKLGSLDGANAVSRFAAPPPHTHTHQTAR